MVEIRIAEDMRCSADRYWELYFDPKWTQTLLIDGLGFTEARIDPVRETDFGLTRHMFVIPKLALPKPVIKVIGEKLGYDEDGRFDRGESTWSWETKLNVLSGKIRMGGEMKIEPVSETVCRRVSRLYCTVKIFGVGGLIEKAAEKSMRDGWGESARWINGWLAGNPPP